MNLAKVKRISVVGNSGAGKSTLSNKLGRSLGLEVFSIDKIYWLPGWNVRDEVSYKEIHEKWIKLHSWIIDGVGYWEEMEHRIAKSNMVIFLDAPVALCKERAETRIKEEELYPNPNITEGCVYGEVIDLQMKVIENFHNELRPKLVNYLSRLNPEKVKVIGSIEELNI